MGASGLSPIAAACLLLAACGGGGTAQSSPKPSGQPSPQVSIAATPSPTQPKSVWVLTPLGLNVRADASTTAARIATAPEGAELVVSESRPVGSQTWLHVKTTAGDEGWVLNDPTLVIAIPVYAHIDTTHGYRILFPQTWTVTGGNPTAIASPPADPAGATLSIQE